MRIILPFLAAGLAAGCMSGPPSERAQAAAAERDAEYSAELADALEGRVAGRPVSCINQRDIRSSKNIGERTILYDTGSVIYRNDPPGGCEGPGLGKTLITRTPSTQLCRGDIARVVDLSIPTEYGSCSYSDFVPYRRRS